MRFLTIHRLHMSIGFVNAKNLLFISNYSIFSHQLAVDSPPHQDDHRIESRGHSVKIIRILFLFLSYSTILWSADHAGVFENFITISNDKLMDGDKEIRFISCNIPNLHYVEDNMIIIILCCFQAKTCRQDSHFKLRFLTEAEVSRVEIKYGR